MLRKSLFIAAFVASLVAGSAASPAAIVKIVPVEKNVRLEVLDWAALAPPLSSYLGSVEPRILLKGWRRNSPDLITSTR